MHKYSVIFVTYISQVENLLMQFLEDRNYIYDQFEYNTNKVNYESCCSIN